MALPTRPGLAAALNVRSNDIKDGARDAKTQANMTRAGRNIYCSLHRHALGKTSQLPGHSAFGQPQPDACALSANCTPNNKLASPAATLDDYYQLILCNLEYTPTLGRVVDKTLHSNKYVLEYICLIRSTKELVDLSIGPRLQPLS